MKNVFDILGALRKGSSTEPKQPENPKEAPEQVTADPSKIVAVSDVEHAVQVYFAERERYEKKQNRNKFWKRTIVISTLGLLGAFFFSTGDSTNEIKIDKTQIGKTLPVLGAVPGAESTAHIAVIKLQGVINGDLNGPASGENTPLYLATALALAEQDPDLVMVVLYINSPGGDAAASDQAYRIVDEAKQRLAERRIPLIAYSSKGIYSGGYYIAVGAEYIYVDRAAALANIGVIMSMFNTAELGKMVGVKENITATGPLKSTGHQWEALSPAQQQMLRKSLEEPFDHFLEAVGKGRKIDVGILKEESQKLEDSRTNGGWFSPREAKRLNLIDGIVPVQQLFQMLANNLSEEQKGKYRSVEFEDYQKKLGITETVRSGAVLTIRSLGTELRDSLRQPHPEVRAE